jgi:hypothetical protein
MMDLLRACKVHTVYWDAARTLKSELVWYWCEPGAKPFPGPQRFSSETWDYTHWAAGGAGEDDETGSTYYSGKPPGTPASKTFCGPAEWFADGCPSDAPPLERNAANLPVCCFGNPPVHSGCSCGAGALEKQPAFLGVVGCSCGSGMTALHFVSGCSCGFGTKALYQMLGCSCSGGRGVLLVGVGCSCSEGTGFIAALPACDFVAGPTPTRLWVSVAGFTAAPNPNGLWLLSYQDVCFWALVPEVDNPVNASLYNDGANTRIHIEAGVTSAAVNATWDGPLPGDKWNPGDVLVVPLVSQNVQAAPPYNTPARLTVASGGP